MLFIAVWAGMLIVFMITRPAPDSLLFWVMIGTAILFGALYMGASHRESRRTQHAIADWLHRVHELVDIRDYQDDGHLPEYLDDLERRRVIDELERMPAGQRSLRRALQTVSPELVDDGHDRGGS